MSTIPCCFIEMPRCAVPTRGCNGAGRRHAAGLGFAAARAAACPSVSRAATWCRHLGGGDGRSPAAGFSVGGGARRGQRAAVNIARRWPHVQVVGVCSPPVGFQNDPGLNDDILNRIADTRPDVLIVGLGAPKQELWVQRTSRPDRRSGGTVRGGDHRFSGRAGGPGPFWRQHSGLEWLHRLWSQPRRSPPATAGAWMSPRLILRDLFVARGSRPRA